MISTVAVTVNLPDLFKAVTEPLVSSVAVTVNLLPDLFKAVTEPLIFSVGASDGEPSHSKF